MLFNYLLQLADNQLILSQRLSELCGHGPALEQDIALTNISLDLIGQARLLFQYAEKLDDKKRNEDQLALVRAENEYRNVLLVEQPNGDYAQTMLRQYFMDVYHVHLYRALSNSSNQQLAAIATKSLKEVIYHLERSDLWIKRMAHGTQESLNRLQTALNKLWHYHHELFEESDELSQLVKQGIAADPKALKDLWQKDVKTLIATSPLEIPVKGWKATGGRVGHHSEYLGKMLCEMQFLQRAYPGCEW